MTEDDTARKLKKLTFDEMYSLAQKSGYFSNTYFPRASWDAFLNQYEWTFTEFYHEMAVRYNLRNGNAI